MSDSQRDLVASRLLDILIEGPVYGGPRQGSSWSSAVIHLTHKVYGQDVEVLTRTDGSPSGNVAYNRYQVVLVALHYLEDLKLVVLHRDPQDHRTVVRAELAH